MGLKRTDGVTATHQRHTPCKHCNAKLGEEHSVTCPLVRCEPWQPALLGEVWMAFGTMDDGRLVALPEYTAVSEREVGSKIMDVARREGYRGLLADRMQSLGWTIRRVSLADGVKAAQPAEDWQAIANKHADRLWRIGKALNPLAESMYWDDITEGAVKQITEHRTCGVPPSFNDQGEKA